MRTVSALEDQQTHTNTKPITAPSFLKLRGAGRRKSDASTERKPTRPRRPIVHHRPSSTAVEVPTPDRFPEDPAIAAISVPAQPATSKVRRALTPRVAQLISPRALKRKRAPARVTVRPLAASCQPAAATKTSPPSSPVPGLQPVFTAVSTAAPPTSTSPVPGSQPAFSHSDDEEPPSRACIDLLPWNLKELTLSPPRRTRPLRETLSPWDIRVRRRTSPRQRRASATPPPRTTSDKENVH
ncbi:uncharacterized protein LOC105279411 [Ooceraea biroi]|uniref:uncharacterized protein LOC105279411 n=1 Tax=Ooceraea biroi TaxID=2015173 RepID=UPI000F074234|nr:uncharacterized protein LOC105279411 [Ooceraea biroi]